MSPNPVSIPTKHRGSRAKTPRRISPKQANGEAALASPAQLLSVEVHPHPKTAELPAREERIRIAAYLLAQQRGFAPGRELEDWLAAEAEIDRVTAV